MANHGQQVSQGNQTASSPATENSVGDTVAKVVGGLGEALEGAHAQVMAIASAVKTGQVPQLLGTIAGEAAATAGKQGQQFFEEAVQGAGKAIGLLGENPLLKQILKLFRAEWLLTLMGGVDSAKAQAAVRKLQQEHPEETPGEIAHRIMVDKAVYAGGIGLASSLMPGVALALLAVDLVATTQLQAEMVYQIAAAYGMDLQAPARRGEVLAIFGLSLGGSEALKAGLGLLRNVPLAGMAIGVSTNAAMMYVLGYAACRFYEAKLNPLSPPVAVQEIQKENDAYLAVAIAQQAIMDRVLVHQILASYPEKSPSEILAQLPTTLNVTPQSLAVLAENLESPEPLDGLLKQLHRDYAIPLLARCYAIAQLDGVVTSEEQAVLSAIATQFDLEHCG